MRMSGAYGGGDDRGLRERLPDLCSPICAEPRQCEVCGSTIGFARAQTVLLRFLPSLSPLRAHQGPAIGGQTPPLSS